MLRADAVSLVLGLVLVVAGLLVVVLWAAARRRTTAVRVTHASGGLWLGLFAILYGVRLLLRTGTFRLCFDVSPIVWDYAASAITYACLLYTSPSPRDRQKSRMPSSA